MDNRSVFSTMMKRHAKILKRNSINYARKKEHRTYYVWSKAVHLGAFISRLATFPEVMQMQIKSTHSMADKPTAVKATVGNKS